MENTEPADRPRLNDGHRHGAQPTASNRDDL
jgi:hypothetical protein